MDFHKQVHIADAPRVRVVNWDLFYATVSLLKCGPACIGDVCVELPVVPDDVVANRAQGAVLELLDDVDGSSVRVGLCQIRVGYPLTLPRHG